jgi:hypothetical protein
VCDQAVLEESPFAFTESCNGLTCPIKAKGSPMAFDDIRYMTFSDFANAAVDECSMRHRRRRSERDHLRSGATSASEPGAARIWTATA